MRRALDMFVVEGIYTTIPLHQRILADPDFVAGKTDTTFLQRWTDQNLAWSAGFQSAVGIGDVVEREASGDVADDGPALYAANAKRFRDQARKTLVDPRPNACHCTWSRMRN